MGAAVAYAGFSSLNGGSILTKILLPLVLSPLAGFGMGLLVMFLIMFLCAKCARNKLNTAFTRLQVLSAAFMATSHGMNDAQKTMGVITLALFIFNEIETIAVPSGSSASVPPLWRSVLPWAAGKSSKPWGIRFQTGTRSRLRQRNVGRAGHLRRVAPWCADQHDAHDHGLHLRRRLDQAPHRRPLGGRGAPHHCLGPYHSRFRSSGGLFLFPFKRCGVRLVCSIISMEIYCLIK